MKSYNGVNVTPVLSIIVPVYKVEKYIYECIDSIIAQSFNDFELILVDDGSPDNCGSICDEYARVDKRIKVIHQENKGLSAARNIGIDIAEGQYITFVDSDDYIEPNMYEIMIEELVANKVDLAVCGVNSFSKRNIHRKKGNEFSIKKNMILSREQCFQMILSKKDAITVSAWNKVYKKELFSNIRYPEGQNYEDSYVITDILSKCNLVYVTSTKLYNYRHRNDGIIRGRYNEKDWGNVISATKNYIYFLKYYPEYLPRAKAYLYKSYFWILGKILLEPDKVEKSDFEFMIHELNSNLKFIITSQEFCFRRKISAIALRIHPMFFKICVLLQKLL